MLDDDAAVPVALQARADETLDEPQAPAREQTSFRSLLAELDGMEQGLKTDFDDLLEAQAADIDSDEEQSTPEPRHVAGAPAASLQPAAGA